MNINMIFFPPFKRLCSAKPKDGTGEYTRTQEKWGKRTLKRHKKNHRRNINHNNETFDCFFNKLQQ